MLTYIQVVTSQLVTRSSRHTVKSSLGQLVTGQLVTGAFFSQSQLVTWSSHHTVNSSQASNCTKQRVGHTKAMKRLISSTCDQCSGQLLCSSVNLSGKIYKQAVKYGEQ